MELLVRAFEKMGARVKFSEAALRRMNGRWTKPNLALDVRTDAKGEFFLISRDQRLLRQWLFLTFSHETGICS